jgi:hypothetical protein
MARKRYKRCHNNNKLHEQLITKFTVSEVHKTIHNLNKEIYSNQKKTVPLFVQLSAFRNFWPPKATADCQTLSFSASFYKIRLVKNHSKST